VLDGASSFDRQTSDASEYVDHLLRELLARIGSEDAALDDVLAAAISATSTQLDVRAGNGPSSTVLLARERGECLEVLALGDSTALTGIKGGAVQRVSDGRLSRTARDLRGQYRARLKSGAGYDDSHRALLAELQQHERNLRNVPDGYWIAEADPTAAHHAVRREFYINQVDWCVLATDGAQRLIDHLQLPWHEIALMDESQLSALLQRLHDWEQFEDPTAKFLPRAKQHDDKVLVTWSPSR
jgi:serine/threonine protein phosphatase PrpC